MNIANLIEILESGLETYKPEYVSKVKFFQQAIINGSISEYPEWIITDDALVIFYWKVTSSDGCIADYLSVDIENNGMGTFAYITSDGMNTSGRVHPNGICKLYRAFIY